MKNGNLMPRRMLVLLATLAATLGLSQVGGATECPVASKDIKERVESYLTQRLVTGTSAKLSVKSIETMADSCYRKLRIEVPGANGDVTMYLSPDERFLTSNLYDLSIEPQKEVARIAGNVNKLLLRDASPRRGGQHARITLVEFGDLQCPYCRHLGSWYRSLPDSLRDQTVLTFKHLPLPQHAWARPAALLGACAGIQSPEAFWRLSDFLMENQSEITTENIERKATAFLAQTPEVNLQKLKTCVTDGSGAAVIERDIAVARDLAVHTTPTLFIDGRRVMTISSADELRQLLERELHGSRPDLDPRPAK